MVSHYKKRGYAQGSWHPNARLSPAQVVEIFLSAEKQEYLAALFEVSQYAIAAIQARRTWRHLTATLQRPTIQKGSSNVTGK